MGFPLLSSNSKPQGGGGLWTQDGAFHMLGLLLEF